MLGGGFRNLGFRGFGLWGFSVVVCFFGPVCLDTLWATMKVPRGYLRVLFSAKGATKSDIMNNCLNN